MEEIAKTKKAALRLLSFKPRSESELRSRLRRKKLPGQAIDEVVAQLRREGWVDDEKFARLYALSRMQGCSLGKNRVRLELTQRGLSGAMVQTGMAAIRDIDEWDAALELAKKRLASMGGVPIEAKKRRLRGLLMRRGFSAETTFKILGQLTGLSEEECA